MSTLDRLDAEFADGEVLHFQGRGNQTFDYIEDETVMDRLDEVLGKGGWYITVEPISVADGIVKVAIHWPTGTEGLVRTYEDFGYQTRDGGEGLKEAVSDGIRRCGRYLGIGRYLYKKHVSVSPQGTGRAGPSSPARPAAPPRSSTSVPDEPEWLEPTDAAPTPIRGKADNSNCPIHDVPWLGEWGDLWHKDPDGRYCRHPENVKRERAAARR